MFETAELGRKVAKKEYKERVEQLRSALLLTQYALSSERFPVLVVFSGVDGAGKGGTVNKLNEWMDSRWILTRAFDHPTQDERERPQYWRYWRALPPYGQLGCFLHAWYSEPLIRRAHGGGEAEFDEALDEITAFENTLAADGALIVKFWMHLGKEAQKKRLKALEKDPLEKWRVNETAWENWRLFDSFVAAAERMITRTSTGWAPWYIIEGEDPAYRSLRVGEVLLERVRGRIAQREEAEAGSEGASNGPVHLTPVVPPPPPPVDEPDLPTVLDKLDMTQALERRDYTRAMKELRGRLNQLQRRAREAGLPSMLVFEGWDAAGKGGAIRRLTRALDARHVRVYPIAAPTDEDRARHYLWRFWRRVPRKGFMAVFDRSWYGRVLVERVEGLAHEADWQRAYAEINAFEGQLVESGMVLIKFWLHITEDEQERRFHQRQDTHYKRWKLTPEDWRNRARWRDYELAVHDMVERTSTQPAPWVLVEGNDKRFARVKILRKVCDALERALG